MSKQDYLEDMGVMRWVVITFAVIGVMALIWLFLDWTQQRDDMLMSLCADHQTQTLYECE